MGTMKLSHLLVLRLKLLKMFFLSISTVKCLMRSQYFRWLSLLSLSLTLFWIVHVVKQDTIHVAVHIPAGLEGYARIADGRTDQFLNMHCKYCAVVSSSGQMLGAAVGDEIDSSECVIRMNNAPTAGYEKDVGSRSTVRVVSHTSAPLLIKNENYYFKQSLNTTYVFWGPERNMRQDGKGRVYNALLKMAKKYPDAKIYSVTREKIQYCDNVFQNETGKNRMKTGAFLSTGFFTMILALDLCDSIHVYGMIDSNYCRCTKGMDFAMTRVAKFGRANHSVVPYHYYEGKRINECRMYNVHENTKRGGHRFITEKAIYARWATRHKMEFKHPSWRP